MTADQPATALLSALTTEHFTLQTARNATIAETSSRTSLFMGAVTGSVVSLALVSQLSETGPAFTFLALTVLPSVLLVGLLTYARLLETSLEDLAYGLAIRRIRAFYLELDPAAERYLLLRPGTAHPVAAADPGMHRSRFHLLGHAATVVAAVDGVLTGTVAGFATHAAGAPLTLSGPAAVLTATAMLLALVCHQWRRWRVAADELTSGRDFPPEQRHDSRRTDAEANLTEDERNRHEDRRDPLPQM
jgi:hypothetical protein